MSGPESLYFCCNPRRRDRVRDHPTLNGIDFVEVSPDQTALAVRLIKPLNEDTASRVHARIDGGERIRNVRVVGIKWDSGSDRLNIQVDAPGDFSMYTLRLIGTASEEVPPSDFDPLLSSIAFSFKVACPSDFDCKSELLCAPPLAEQPAINYLAKDYASFRQLMLDRLAVLIPKWQERSPADLGVTLVELLAFVGDHLSYRQDAIATEAYLNTARQRVSVRRHARLVDYRMHEGCNSRVFVQFEVNDDVTLVSLEAKAKVLTRIDQLKTRVAGDALAKALRQRPEVFETLQGATLYPSLKEIRFHTWGDERCCLPAGAVRATLKNVGHRLGDEAVPKLNSGDFLIFEEILGPRSGKPADADPSHRHIVRLIKVQFTEDPVFADPEESEVDEEDVPFTTPEEQQPLPVVEIEWSAEDALPFPLCLWQVEGDEMPGRKSPVSVARGNVVLADHGLSIEAEDLGEVPAPHLFLVHPPGSPCKNRERDPILPRFRPRLKEAPLTFAKPHDPANGEVSAAELLRSDPARANPQITLITALGTPWERPQPDLLNSPSDDPTFVVEMETSGVATLRFGDGVHGQRPSVGTRFFASYRVGNGSRGNVGAEAIAHVVSGGDAIVRVRNPLPAQGGTDPESFESVRQSAPVAFRTQERAVTLDDYVEVAGRLSEVQRAAATLRWTGSWYTTFVSVDRLGGLPVDPRFEQKMRDHLELFRLAGHDLEVDAPRYVPLRIDMTVCVLPDYFRSDVARALLDLFGSGCRADGTRGLFHPDNFTFGQPVYLSPLYAAAQRVAGVASVRIIRFERRDVPSRIGIRTGRLAMAPLEIARLDNDPNFAERGVFHLSLAGGK